MKCKKIVVYSLAISFLFQVFSAQASYSVPAPKVTPEFLASVFAPQFGTSSSSVRVYVYEMSLLYGVNPAQSLWILSKESQDCGWERNGYFEPDIKGDLDAGVSVGCFQINRVAHPDVPISCVESLPCSAEWSLKQMAAGRADMWSTWRWRRGWFGWHR